MTDNDNNSRKQPFMLLPTIESRILMGVLSFTGIIIIIFWVAINEPARMEEFTDRSEGRSVENGATLFESNCSGCHGNEGYGLAAVAPALNNPQLFGYDFFEEIDLEIKNVQDQIAATDDEAELTTLNEELAIHQLEREQLFDDLRYNYNDTQAELEAELAALEAEIEAADFNPSRLGLEINRIQAEIDSINAELEGTDTAPGILDVIAEAEAAGQEVDQSVLDRRDELQAQLDELQTELTPIREFDRERNPLVSQIEAFSALNEANNTIANAREELISIRRDALESGADISAQADELLSTINTTIPARDEAFQALIDNGSIVPFDPDAESRMDVLRWNGSLHDLVSTTLVAGRPTSASYWPNPMAAWSQQAGGPLRGDQIMNLADYILNWDREFTREDVRKINQYAKIPGDSGGAPAAAAGEAVGTDVAAILASLEGVEGDSNNGQALYTQYGCSGCHAGGAVGPAPEGIVGRAEGHAEEIDRVQSARWYLVESIVQPNAFVVEGYVGNLMPQNFGDTLTIDQLADIIAYLESFDQ